jgi:predicted nucleic acid-binding protein
VRAAALRRERPRLKSPDAVILATAQLRSRVLVTRNTKDFPAQLPGVRVPYLL